MSGGPRVAIYGPEPWRTARGAEWSHWDLWYCVLAVTDHDGDLEQLAAALEGDRGSYGGSTVEAKLSHLDDLRRRLRDAGLDTALLAGDAAGDQRVRGKARAKILKQGLAARDLTDAMRNTPRRRLYCRALRGRWQLFPASPQPVYDRLGNGLGRAHVPKGATFRLERRLQAARDRLARQTAKDPAARLAAQRALVAVGYEAMRRCDDSYGVIGELVRETLITYAKLPFNPAGIAEQDWCEDLCELLVWEDWGLLYRHETRPYAQINGPLADHAEGFLLALHDELRDHRLRHESTEALDQIAYIHVAAGRVTRFTDTAARIGSDRWMPIVALAQAAVDRGRSDIAADVFAAADQPGLQRDYLRQRCVELTGATPPTEGS